MPKKHRNQNKQKEIQQKTELELNKQRAIFTAEAFEKGAEHLRAPYYQTVKEVYLLAPCAGSFPYIIPFMQEMLKWYGNATHFYIDCVDTSSKNSEQVSTKEKQLNQLKLGVNVKLNYHVRNACDFMMDKYKSGKKYHVIFFENPEIVWRPDYQTNSIQAAYFIARLVLAKYGLFISKFKPLKWECNFGFFLMGKSLNIGNEYIGTHNNFYFAANHETSSEEHARKYTRACNSNANLLKVNLFCSFAWEIGKYLNIFDKNDSMFYYGKKISFYSFLEASAGLFTLLSMLSPFQSSIKGLGFYDDNRLSMRKFFSIIQLLLLAACFITKFFPNFCNDEPNSPSMTLLSPRPF